MPCKLVDVELNLCSGSGLATSIVCLPQNMWDKDAALVYGVPFADPLPATPGAAGGDDDFKLHPALHLQLSRSLQRAKRDHFKYSPSFALSLILCSNIRKAGHAAAVFAEPTYGCEKSFFFLHC